MNGREKSSRWQKRQSGQAIVIIALVMVGLIGALGLAIDGGGLMFLYRDIQNATDAAIVAATYARCTNATPEGVVAAGMQAALDNGFNNDGVNNWVTVSNPPPAGAARAGNIDFVEVTIRALKPSYFIQLVYPHGLEVTNGSTGRCRPPFSPATIGAVFGISETCNNPETVNMQGADLEIWGDVHSNRGLKFNGSDQTVTGAGSYVTGGADNIFSGGVSVTDVRPDPLASHFQESVFLPDGRVYNHAVARSMAVRGDSSLVHVINGNLSGKNLVLEGYYLVYGNVDISDAVIGDYGVTIVAYSRQVNGNWTGGYISIKDLLQADYFIDGILLYSNRSGSCNDQIVSLQGKAGNETDGNGNSDRVCGPASFVDANGDGIDDNEDDRQVLRGLIYVPHGLIDFSVPRANLVGALVGDVVSASAARSCIWYDQDILDPIPPQIEVAQ